MICMTRLHLAPSYSVAETLRQALRLENRVDEVIAYADDLSCGPIENLSAARREEWWRSITAGRGLVSKVEGLEFWDRLRSCQGDLIVWASRSSARECSFAFALTHELSERDLRFVDIGTIHQPLSLAQSVRQPLSSVVETLTSQAMRVFIGTERALPDRVRTDMQLRWQTLKRQDTAFRLMSDSSLVSVPNDYFDDALLSLLDSRPKSIHSVLGEAISHRDLQWQVNLFALRARIVALAEADRIQIEGCPWSAGRCLVRSIEP